ncbi:MAG: hypothetical protein D6731_24850 [Planctomycetota bacterium]|nr:MAG: hypothetical protein D6731_24850 [Planctomycetota bacterium]
MQRVGRYEVTEVLGRGAAGLVLAARDTKTDREVAVKLLLDPSGEAVLRRFEREARALAGTAHPGLVAFVDHGVDAGRPYLVMERLHGESLAERLRRGPLAPEEAARCVRDAAHAVQSLHAAGVLHRDIKPENLLCVDGRTVVVDFGLARDAGSALERLTRTGDVLGTPATMPPEQAAGDPSRQGPRSDVYSLGATLYMLLCGRPPFDHPELYRQLLAVVENTPPPPSQYAPVPPPLEAIVLRCLEKDPERRYPSAGALAEALDAFLAHARPGPPAAAWALLGGAGAATALLAGWVFLRAPRAERPPPGADDRAGAVSSATGARTPADASHRPATSSVVAESPPEWYRALPLARRPPLPLPRGLRFGTATGEYVNERDGTVLLWTGEGLFLAREELRRSQYERYCAETGARLPPPSPTVSAAEDPPLTGIDWLEAQHYARWAGLDLPTASERRAAALRLAPGSDEGETARADPTPRCTGLTEDPLEWLDLPAAEGDAQGEATSLVGVDGGDLFPRAPRDERSFLLSRRNDLGVRLALRVGAGPRPLPPAPLKWSLRLFPSGTRRGGPGASPPDDRDFRRRAAEARPLPWLGPLRLPFAGGSPAEGAPRLRLRARDHFGLVAEAAPELPAGRWGVDLVCDDGARLFVDGRLLLDSWAYGHSRARRAFFVLEEARAVRLRLEYFELDGFAVVDLALYPAPRR